jgi:hypothetical protein
MLGRSFLVITLMVGCGPQDPVDSGAGPLDLDGDGWAEADDCDDQDPEVYPGAAELCDGVDNDCDDEVDEDPIDGLQLWTDSDGDGYGSAEGAVEVCEATAGLVEQAGDCDDDDPERHPDAEEHCDGVDEDCDGAVDEDAVDGQTWWLDADGDGHGSDTPQARACEPPDDAAEFGDDCDDDDPDSHPGAAEICGDGVDQDCDGEDPSCGALSGSISVEDAWWTFYGTDFDMKLGNSSAAMDFDGDGQLDIVTTAPMDTLTGAASGVARIHLGPFEQGSGPVNEGAYLTIGTEATGASLGAGLSVLPDLDGDGDQELCVGRTNHVEGGLVLGGSARGEQLLEEISLHDLSCSTAVVMGDSDGSGAVEWAYAHGSSLVPVRDGLDPEPIATYEGLDTYDLTGHGLAGGEDVDGDGLVDLWIGAQETSAEAEDSGTVYLVLAPFAGGSLANADAFLYGTRSQAAFGSALATGDLNGDGWPDLVVGAEDDYPAGHASGALYIFEGPFADETFTSEADAVLEGFQEDMSLGRDELTMMDFDGDSLADLLAGSYTFDDYGTGNQGALWILYGAIEGSGPIDELADVELIGSAESDIVGASASLTGDLTGDGRPDLLVGANGFDNPDGVSCGGVFLFSGE